MKDIGIIGGGDLGGALAEVLHAAGRLSWMVIRNPEQHKDFVYEGVHIYTQLSEAHLQGMIIILAIPDDAIPPFISDFNVLFPEPMCKAIVHCSGALMRGVLNHPTSAHSTFAMHPFQSVRTSADIVNVPWGIECEDEDKPWILEFMDIVKGIPFFFDEEQLKSKAMYHAIAVLSANFLTMLTALSAELAHHASIPPALFLPRIQSTVLQRAHESLSHDEFVLKGLTGPLIRKDIETLKAHRESVRDIKGLEEVYIAMNKAAIHLLTEHDVLSNEDAIRLFSVLSS